MDLYLETFAVADMVRDIGAVIHPLAEKNRNRLDVRCAPDAGQRCTPTSPRCARPCSIC